MIKEDAPYLKKITSIKQSFLDALWNENQGWYQFDNGPYWNLGRYIQDSRPEPYTWLNAYMTQTIAILAGRGAATEVDKARAKIIINKLTTSPAYSKHTWTHFLDRPNADAHEALDQVVAEALYYSYKYKSELDLDITTIKSIHTILTTNYVDTGLYTKSGNLSIDGSNNDRLDNQNLCKWQLARFYYKWKLGEDRSDQLRTCIAKCIYFLENKFGPENSGQNSLQGLFPDFGWRYNESMKWPAFEYGAMSLGGFLVYANLSKAHLTLSRREREIIRTWRRQILGQWQTNGYPNWDSGWSSARIHSASYYFWSLRSLLGIAISPEFNTGKHDHQIAKWLFDRALDTIERMDGWNEDQMGDHSISTQPLGVLFSRRAFKGHGAYNNNKGTNMAKLVSEISLFIELGLPKAKGRPPMNLWTYSWTTGSLHVSTNAYSTSSLTFAPRINLWGADAVQTQSWSISRFQAPNNRILAGIGGYDTAAYALFSSFEQGVDFNTSRIKPSITRILVDGKLKKFKDYDTQIIPVNFQRSLVTVNEGDINGHQVLIRTEYRNSSVISDYKIRPPKSLIGQKSNLAFSIPTMNSATISTIDKVSNAANVLDRTTKHLKNGSHLAIDFPLWSTIYQIHLISNLSLSVKLFPIDKTKFFERQKDQGDSILIEIQNTMMPEVDLRMIHTISRKIQ